jgi:capsular exopolysaccharide synthesis family protein
MSNQNFGQQNDVLLLKRGDQRRYDYCSSRLPDMQQGKDRSQLIEYLQIVRRHIISILVFAFIGIAAGALISLLTPPMYRARTTLDIQEFNENILNVKSGAANPNGGGAPAESYIQTEIKILQSESMARRAVAKLKKAPPKADSERESAVAAWSKGLGQQASPTPKFTLDVLLGGISRGLKVRTLGLTRIVEVLCDTWDAKVAAVFCNTLADEYIAQNSETRWQATTQTGEWLGHQLEDLKRRLARSEEQLTQAARATGALVLADDQSLAQEKLRQLQNELSSAQAERFKRQSLFEMASASPSDAIPLFTNGPAREYQVKLTDLRRQLAELASTVTPSHYKMQQVESQITVLQSTLDRERAAVIDHLGSEYHAGQRREGLLTDEYNAVIGIVSDQAAKAVQYNMLKREVESGRQIYQNMLHRVEELQLASAMRASTIRVVDRAVTPTRPFTPNWSFNCVVGFFGGIFLGVGLAFVRFRSDRSLQSPGEAPALLNVRELGVIPSASFQGRSLFAKHRFPRSLSSSAHHAEALTKLELATLHQRHSVLAESFTAAMNSLLFAPTEGTHASKVIVITSPESGDGKTTIASNLAIALSQIDRRVLLIDGDLRQPRLSSVFEMEGSPGLIELLTKPAAAAAAPVNALVHSTYIPQLSFLPSGNRHAFESKLLHSVRMQELIRRFRGEFDIVLIDSPPIAQFSDARVLGRWADGVLLVFRSNKTTLEIAMAAQQCFMGDGTRVLGTLLNDWNPRQSANFRSYQRGYPDIKAS